MLARATDKNRRFPHAVLCKTRDQDRGNGEEEKRRKRRKRRRGERREEEEKRFLCVLGTPRRPEHTKPMSRSQTLSFPALQNEEWRDRGEGGELWRELLLVFIGYVKHNRIHVGMCSLALPGLSWPSVSCSLTTKSQLMSSFRVMQTIQTLANGVLGRKEEQPPQNSWVGHTLNIDAISTFRYELNAH